MHSKGKRKLRFALRKTIVDFLDNTSIHGLKYTTVKETTYCERTFWGIVICVMFMVAVYLSVLHLRRFIENPMRSTIITFHGPVYLVPFPAVTICNSNLVLHSKITPFLESLNLKNEEKEFLEQNIPQFLGFFTLTDYNKTHLSKMHTIFEKLGYADVVTVLQKVGPSCEEMLIQCRWDGKGIDCLKIFEPSFTIDGLCCSFNYYGSRFNFKPYYTGFTGKSSGLSVTINSMPQQVSYSTEKATGIKVTIHDSLEYPGYERTYKIVSVGTSASFQISAEKLTNTEDVLYLSKNQRNCVFSGEIPMIHHRSYHYSNCVVETYSRLIFEYCGCVPFYFTFSGKPKCSISRMECLQRYIEERRATDLKDIDCPARCENVIYRVFSSNVLINNVSVALSEKNRKKIPDGSGIRLNVFFISTTTLLSRDVITSPLDLLSSIGGIYGLFMGCSFITIVEVIYYCTLRFLVNLGWLGRTRRAHRKRTNYPKSEFRGGLTHRSHDVHGIGWNNANTTTFSRIG